MSDLVPATPAQGSLLQPLNDPAGGSVLTRLRQFAQQPPVRRALPWFAGLAALGVAALVWGAMATGPQRTLYSSLNDAERADVAAALDTGGIKYAIDNATGALTVGESDLYRARMLVASNGALAAPETGTELLNSLPMGASRTLEGDRLRTAQERELALTIAEIDGVEAVRVHLAKADRSVFVREDIAPSASVMVRMARGRQMADSQVRAIANLVAGSVPGLASEAVQIVDQHGRLLSQPQSANSDRLELQARMEAKLRAQVDQLLAPMIGAGNFSSEIQVELNMDEVTSARESYDKDGAVRRESLQESQMAGNAPGMGVPGVLSNTPPIDAVAENGAPLGTPAQGAAQGGGGESSATRTYELGREVAVSNTAPGGVKRLSVAVALDEQAMQGTTPQQLAKMEELVAAAVGADEARGDRVAVLVRAFQPAELEEMPVWETAWFATMVRNGVALLSVLLVLLLAVRPLIKALTGGGRRAREREQEEDEALASMVAAQGTDGAEEEALPEPSPASAAVAALAPSVTFHDRTQLHSQIEAAQRLVREKPEDALAALRRMLNETPDEEPEAVR